MLSRFVQTKCFSTSAVAWARRRRPVQDSERAPNNTSEDLLKMPDFSKMSTQELFELEDMPEFADQDSSGAGHRQLMHEREVLHYLRLIDGEMQNLQVFRQKYQPRDNAHPLIARSISYGNEEHPTSDKRTLIVPVSQLQLGSSVAVHKLILLAGPRWSASPPKDSGVGSKAKPDPQGYIKLSCELFPQSEMNLKWTIDVLNKLINSAKKNAKKTQSFRDIPLDFRHLEVRRRKQKKGEHRAGLQGIKPTIKDFPKEWLMD